ncbi:MAG: hypothetical protein IVW55_07430 [Chloroflexi bacterium]|nr:hypothetical protein [Chloroflexota bacterium]
MSTEEEWLNKEIERTRRGRCGSAPPAKPAEVSAEQMALLQMAANLNSLNAEASQPDPAFVARLRYRILGND